MRKSIRENIVFILIAHTLMLSDPAIVFAENENYSPINFTQPLSTDRGKIIPLSSGSLYLNNEETCKFFTEKMGWDKDECKDIDRFVVRPATDIESLIVSKPVTEGYVKLDDWTGDISNQIDQLQKEMISSLGEQSKRLGKTITFDSWIVYPHVDKVKNVMYYAFKMNWDGVPSVNVALSVFDRYGYVAMKAVPSDAKDTESLQKAVSEMEAIYKPNDEASYSSFKPGDKVAAYGAVGVLATLLGVKYGKAAAVGLYAIVLIFLKKLWFLILMPFAFLKKILKKNKTSE